MRLSLEVIRFPVSVFSDESKTHRLIQNVTEDCLPIGAAASANRIVGVYGGRDQHGRTARGRSGGGEAVCSSGAAR
jgi:hypothetical protein